MAISRLVNSLIPPYHSGFCLTFSTQHRSLHHQSNGFPTVCTGNQDCSGPDGSPGDQFGGDLLVAESFGLLAFILSLATPIQRNSLRRKGSGRARGPGPTKHTHQRRPGLFLAEIQERLYDSSGTLLCVETVHQNLVQRLSITLKKPKTRNIHESSFCDNDLLRSYARLSRRTPAARFFINQNPLRLSLLAAISMEGLVALTTTTKTFNGCKFEHFLKYDLLPQMNCYPDYNSVLGCNNATVHQGKRVRDLCEAAGVWLLFLPPYFPELNPIELGFAAIKQNLRASQVLNDAINPEWEIQKVTGKLLTAEFSYKVFRHAGYCVPPSPN
ncbi:hypothetical protein PTTG_25792 [Puccinia triticina 1-1 BBBD Race 1]|uniref:DDE_3 domain-containing protein n=1 Tax=Puccinia triticina (isolate 1-1 / race 1 (BBBD)) TaxID=630390 RepID=A0A180GZ01_PUCT1|nr:hypothetical protein PTTG_25792 [Puccinia triticina 1-1 BBBD Race 1]